MERARFGRVMGATRRAFVARGLSASLAGSVLMHGRARAHRGAHSGVHSGAHLGAHLGQIAPGEGHRPVFLPAHIARLDGAEFVLTDVRAPDHGAPFAARAARLRDEWLQLNSVRASPRDRDRWGRATGLLLGAGGDTLQGALIDAGAARVVPQSDDHALIGDLLVREAAARRAGAGLWALPDYAVRDAARPRAIPGGYQIVEGAVRETGRSSARIYLNFGARYQTDFTASLRRGARRHLFPDMADTLEEGALNGTTIRVRGFVYLLNGPTIELDHRDQLERLDRASGG